MFHSSAVVAINTNELDSQNHKESVGYSSDETELHEKCVFNLKGTKL